MNSSPPRFGSLDEWLNWQETLHPESIDLRIERVSSVADRLGLRDTAIKTVTVAGTNGKGTAATVLSALLAAMGYRVGLYTSPHLLRYNERVAICGQPASDQDLCAAFAEVDLARGADTLTYFEFGTLAAVWLFRRASVDFQILEVGMGGRLDAVNAWDADLAIITGVDLDHERWLGPDRESIGREKAGVLRPGRPVVLGEETPPRSVLERAGMLGSPSVRQGVDFALVRENGLVRWRWRERVVSLDLPESVASPLDGARARNAGSAIAAAHMLGLQQRLSDEVLAAGLAASPPGRLQRIPGMPEWLLDVSHNPQSVRELARWLVEHPVGGATAAIVAVMADKQRGPMLDALAGLIDAWIPVSIDYQRALPAGELARELTRHGVSEVTVAEDPQQAIEFAIHRAGSSGRVVVFGSFLTVQAVLERLPVAAGIGVGGTHGELGVAGCVTAGV